MIKKLDILILRAFIGPFIATFIVSEFILVLQFYWVYLDDFVGKGLNLGTILYVTWLVSIVTFQLALPLALLLSSIMTFGNLGETFEIVAIKSAGISLTRFMRPLFVTTLLLSGIAFVFANNVIPFATLRLNMLKHDIFVSKPALDIKEGVFYKQINGYVIKIARKEKNDSIIHGVIIYEKNNGLQDNILTAETGIMRVSNDKQFLEFTLKDGIRYSERGNRGTLNTEFTRMGFREYKKLFDLSDFMQASRKEDSSIRYDPSLLSVRQLNYSIDSLAKQGRDSFFRKRSTGELDPWLAFSRFRDSNWQRLVRDTFRFPAKAPLIPAEHRQDVYNRTLSQFQNIKTNLEILQADYNRRQESVTKHYIEWHKKFALAFACIVLFMIGAPLGAIIRKGGLGMPLVFALVFFAVFHLLNTFGAKFANEEVLSPFTGIWLASLVLTPVGIFLTYKAMNDSQLFNRDFYGRTFRKARIFFVTLFQSKKHKSGYHEQQPPLT